MFAHMLHACGVGCACIAAFPRETPPALGFFEFVHNVRKRGKALLRSLNYWSHKTLESNISDPLLVRQRR